MNLVFFIHENSSNNGVIFKNVINKNFNESKPQIFHTFNSFKTRLKRISKYNDKEIFILFADSEKRLKKLTSLIYLLEDRRLILILPNESEETLSRACQFFPRFFTPISDTYNDFCDVLNKMII